MNERSEPSVSVRYYDHDNQILAWVTDSNKSELSQLPEECIAQFMLVHRSNKLSLIIRPRSEMSFRFTNQASLQAPAQGCWDVYTDNDFYKTTWRLLSFPRPQTWDAFKSAMFLANKRLREILERGGHVINDASDDET